MEARKPRAAIFAVGECLSQRGVISHVWELLSTGCTRTPRLQVSPRLTIINIILIYIHKIAHGDVAMGMQGRGARRARAPQKFKKCPGTH